MNAPNTAYEHIFNTVRRELNDELPELTVMFLPCAPGQQEETLKTKSHEIIDHPLGEQTIALYNDPQNKGPENFPTLFTHSTKTKLFGTLKKHKSLALCFVNLQKIKIFEDENFSYRHAAYIHAFEAIHLHLMQSRSPKEKDISGEGQNKALRIKLMGNCFAAMLAQMNGPVGTLQQIIKRYCFKTIEPAKSFSADTHLLPLAVDGLGVVYRDLKDKNPLHKGMFEHAYDMAREIGETYDDISLQQWQFFVQNTQEMAWGKHNGTEILSAAVYGSDNPYFRSNAHICAEKLNTTPVPLKHMDFYNPFADNATSERLHTRHCNQAFQQILHQAQRQRSASVFLQKARAQTQRFIDGHPLGWCAPALIEAENAFRLYLEKPRTEERTIQHAFETGLTATKWQDIRALNLLFIELRRKDIDLTPQNILSFLEKRPLYAGYMAAFELLK